MSRAAPPHRCLVLVAAVALCTAGCGRADDRRTATAVTEAFLAAIQDGNGSRACAHLTDGAIQALEHDEGKRCPEAAASLDIDASPVARAKVYVTGAKVDLTNGDSAFLELTSRGWHVSAAGCRPEPDDRPYTCEVQA